jgi:hypothetical protein
LIFDVLKGMLPVWGAYALGVTPFWLGSLIAACVGHIWPVFFGFKGKGVATAFGAIAPIGWDLTGVMAGTWLLTILLSGYSSLGAIVSALIAPFYVWWFKPQFTFPVSMLSPYPAASSRQYSAPVASSGDQNLDEAQEEEKDARKLCLIAKCDFGHLLPVVTVNDTTQPHKKKMAEITETTPFQRQENALMATSSGCAAHRMFHASLMMVLRAGPMLAS